MNDSLKIVAIGISSTLMLDIWNRFLYLFNINSLDYRYVGRWIGNFHIGKFYHKNIMISPAIQFELYIGWIAHYLIGISFSFLLIIMFGKEWLAHPTLLPAVITGFITVLAPLFVMQPALGFGIASSKLKNPLVRLLKSLVTHLVYGTGLYLSAQLFSRI